MNPMRAIVFASIVLLAGCSTRLPRLETSLRGDADLLARADAEMAAENYQAALRLYDESLESRSADAAAPRVRTTRTALARLIEVELELERLREAHAATERMLAEQLSVVEQLKADVDRVRIERERLRSEAERVRADRERLRSALERLRTIDLEEPRR